MLTSTISWPVLLRMAVSSTAHSSGASRLVEAHRATQPCCCGALGCACVGCAGAAGDGAAWACLGDGAALFLCACAETSLKPHNEMTAAKTTNLAMIFTRPLPQHDPEKCVAVFRRDHA